MANDLHLAIPDLDADLNAVLQVMNPADMDMKHFLLTLQSFRNLSTILQNLTNLEKKMSDQIDALTAEVANTASVEQAAAKTLSAADDAIALLQKQLASATNPADQAAIQAATSNLAAARAELQTAVDTATKAIPPAPTGTATSAPSATPSDPASPAGTSGAASTPTT